ncbi:MAG TPA: phosphohistidine phosphatase SixA [Cyanobacteria bacterium UBA8156]|jgi:phosphohistidine phosphatase|nr:phosphohistidine phosphatase SixA [Cyanobacteria bacterium UBA8156]
MTFNLYFIRHGLAVERSEHTPDGDRPLTPEGRHKTERVVKRLRELGLGLDALVSSPLVRAQQTAEILTAVYRLPIETWPELAPDTPFETWLARLLVWQSENPTVAAVGMVGHEPELSNWAEILLWGGCRDAIALKKAGVLGLTIPRTVSPVGEAFLFLLVPPKILL